ncbi:MAG TPA: hypothetical protein PL125_05580 [Candidatus Omnitrophota bacterium]|nr:hypothetical protein [Candidatus Omnitrophota bacterium]HPT39646.1 hypothetical protein [Candidatus Omnitrophota bacterium]
MFRSIKCFSLVFLFLFFCLTFVSAEEITITSYYPSPYGSYKSLQTDKLGVGDNNADGSFTAADVPTVTGEVWIKGNVNIGKGAVSPTYALDVNGTVNATAYRVGATAGLTQTLTVLKTITPTSCTITVNNGIITASTC